MYMRAITYRIAYVAVLSAGIVLAAAFRDSTAQAAPAAAAASRQADTVAATAVLPVVTLPAVHVRSAAHPTAPKLPAAAVLAASGAAIAAGTNGGSTSLPSLRLDMPFYSFGKLLPRVGKE